MFIRHWGFIRVFLMPTAKTLFLHWLIISLSMKRKSSRSGRSDWILYDSDSNRARQLNILSQQLQLAADFDKPVILHVRKAHDLTLQQLRRVRLSRGGVVHAFSGSEQQAREYIKLGFKLGVGGSITYERARKLRRTFAALPLSALVLETDAPDMPLCGYQGETNYPERAAQVANVLAELRGVTPEEIAAATLQNTREVFRV